MSLLKQIDDKGAVLAWSRLAAHPGLVALGTKDSAGGGFDDYGGELELHQVDFSDARTSSSKLLGKARASSRFASIAWSEMATRSADFSYGLVAGGMVDGTIHVWDPAQLVAGNADASLLVSVAQHQGSIQGLQFNPHKESSHLLASGGSDGEVFVMALDRPDQPNVFIPAPPPNQVRHTADITRVAWNSQVAHILASAAQNGSCIVWDLRQKKSWCELRDPTGCSISDIAWNPDQGLHLVTAGGDDKNPVIKLWDLRSSTSVPLATLQGHTQGVMSVSWCPSDPSLLLSCGKDNKTLLWDLFHLQPVYELPVASAHKSEEGAIGGGAGFGGGAPAGGPAGAFDGFYGGAAQSQGQSMFGNLAASAGSRRYHVAWSPCIPAVISTCSFDRSVQFFSLSGSKSKLGRAPKWLRKPVGATFGFGGKLVYFNNKHTEGPAGAGKGRGISVRVKIVEVVDNPSLIASCDSFHNALASGDLKAICASKASTASTAHEAQIWTLMKIICFEKNAREELLSFLGFDAASIEAAAQSFVTHASQHSHAGVNSAFDGLNLSGSPASAAGAEESIRNALVVGNFAAAVDVCIEANLMAEALLLAQCGDPGLWTKTQNIFFEKFREKRPFLNILHAVINGKLKDLVNASDLKRWRETLAIISTYGKSEEFAELCELLGTRLDAEDKNSASATLCFMCANNVPRTVAFWIEELKHANAMLGQTDPIALQQFIEKVVVYTEANKPAAGGATEKCPDLAALQKLLPECAEFFAYYANLLASQGRLEIVSRYLRGDTEGECILRDRAYHAGGPKPAGSRPPQFPFVRVNVAAKAGTAASSHGAGHPAASGASSKAQPIPAAKPKAAVQQAATSHFEPHAVNGNANVQNNMFTPVEPVQQPSVPQLPPGWLQLVDPTSGRPYYVNQATSQSQWEPPVAVEPVHQAAALAPVPVQPVAAAFTMAGNVTDVHRVAEQPVHVASTPVMPAVQAATPAGPAAVSSAPVAEAVNSASLDTLNDVIQSLMASASPADKRQLQAVVASHSVLVAKVQAREVAADVMAKVDGFVAAIASKNFAAANSIQMDLANTCWALHKEWIKGFKVLIQMASKK